MRPIQKRNFIAYYIEIKLKERDANFSLSDMIQKISQFRYTEQAHNFEQYEKEILQFYKKKPFGLLTLAEVAAYYDLTVEDLLSFER